MSLSVTIGLTHFALRVSNTFVVEGDLRGTLFVRVWGVGELWLQRGASCFNRWSRLSHAAA